MKNLLLTLMMLAIFATQSFANQIGATFTEDAIGVLGDYEKSVASWEFATDAQAQLSDTRSLIANASIQRSFGSLGVKPFISYNKDALGDIVDTGGVINLAIGGLDISAGASFRGANPTADTGIDGFDADGNEIKYFTDDPSNTYQLPGVNNINGVFQTGFEKWRIETTLTGYVPLTERDIVPVVLISRSQTSIDITDGLGLSLVVDGRTYLHADGAEISFTPMGSVTYKF